MQLNSIGLAWRCTLLANALLKKVCLYRSRSFTRTFIRALKMPMLLRNGSFGHMRWVACWLAMTSLTMCGMYVPVILMLPFLGPSPLLFAKMDVAFHLFRRWPMRAWKFYIGGAHSNQRSSNCRHLLVLECIVSCYWPVYTSMELLWSPSFSKWGLFKRFVNLYRASSMITLYLCSS